ncbi:MAG: IS630 family transposase [Xanthomonadales bacterium]|nr:IS630 family transposase [Xanthomonadales bacterium]NIX12236.1 IS630 family transposase [Xanthomonadales bacterium]
MTAELRRARYGHLLALHVLLLSATGRTPTEIASFLFCSRSSVYRIVQAYQAGRLAWAEDAAEKVIPPDRTHPLSRSLQRTLVAILKASPRACGWCRTRWSCATVALELQARRGCTVSAETVRRWLHTLGWEWKRAKLVAKDDDPQRVEKLARIRRAVEQVGAGMALVFADELDIHLLPKVGYQWMPRGTQVEVLTPGTNEKRYLAGALDLQTGEVTHCVWYRKVTGLFLDLLATLDRQYPVDQFAEVSVVVDNAQVHYAQAVADWLAAHPRFALLYLPTYCPRANPIERAFGDVHDHCTRNHTRTRIGEVVKDVEQHFAVNGPWQYQLSEIYYTPEVTAAVEALTTQEELPLAA